MEYPELSQKEWEEVVNSALLTASEKSNGQLTDFSEHSPVRALFEGVTWVTEDFSYRLNRLPYAIINQWLEFWGIKGSVALPSRGYVSLTLIGPVSVPIVFDIGTRFYTSSDPTVGPVFVSLEAGTIPPFAISVTLPVASLQAGFDTNLPMNSLSNLDGLHPSFSLVSNVTSTALTGGMASQEDESRITSSLSSITTNRTLLTENDYRVSIGQLMPGSTIVVMPNLGPDGSTVLPGSVHCYVLVRGYRGINPSEVSTLVSALSQYLPVGFTMYISPIKLREFYVRAIVTLKEFADIESTYEEIKSNLRGYLDPYNFTDTSILYKEMEYQARLPIGVNRVGGCYISEVGLPIQTTNTAVNVPLNFDEKPTLVHISVTMIGSGFEINLGDSFIPDEIPDTQEFDIAQSLEDEFA